ncbi:MAG: DUF4249 domain-containing protein [Bacteroidota bacterium]
MNRSLFFLSIIFCLASCEDFFSSTLEVEPPAHESQIVLHTVVTDADTVALAAIGRSVGLLDNIDAQDLFLHDADLALYQGNNKLFDYEPTDPFLGAPSGFNYKKVMNGPIATAGQTYTIKGNHSVYGAITASQTMPRAIPVTSTLIREDHGIMEGGERTDQAELTFTDPEGEDNYYEVSLFIVETFEGVDFASGLYSITYDPNLREAFSNGFLLNDDAFDGRTYKLLLEYTPYWSDQQDVDVYAIFRTVTRDYYLYTSSVYNQENAEDFGFFAEPVSLHTNVDNGLGIFGMRAETIVKLTD